MAMPKKVAQPESAVASLKNRIRDEMAGIRQGTATVDLHPRGMKEPEILPELKDLGLPGPVRKQLGDYIAAHADYGKVKREAEKEQERISKEIKALMEEHVPEDAPVFYSDGIRVSKYKQKRSSLNKDKARDGLLNRGVQPGIISAAFDEATTVTEVTTVRITPPGEDE